MNAKNTAKYEALMQQADFNIARFDQRRDYSWKVSIGFWAAILGIAAIVKESTLALPLWAVLIAGGLILFLIPLLHAYWLANVFEANPKDKLLAFKARDLAIELLDVDIELPELQSEKKLNQDWSVQFQWFTTLFLTVASVAYVVI